MIKIYPCKQYKYFHLEDFLRTITYILEAKGDCGKDIQNATLLCTI